MKYNPIDNIIFESKSSLDRSCRTKTGIAGFFPLILFIVFFVIQLYNKEFSQILAILIIFWIIALVFGYSYTPRQYILTKLELIIKRPLGAKTINLNDVIKVRHLNKTDLQGLWRKFAVEGLFGNFGYYSTKKYKTLNFYTSRDSNWVLIENKSGKKYVISPDDIKMIDKIKEIIERKLL